MFANERQNRIYEIIKNNGAVTTSKLVEMFGVSVETVRRDLIVLEQNGRLTKVHGGAVAKNDVKPYKDKRERDMEFKNEKYELALTATEFVSEGDVIGIDSGSTAVFFAEALKERFSKLTVVTHSAEVFEILSNCGNFDVILCGGHYMREENAFYGELALGMLDNMHLQKSFVFPTAISIKNGVFDYQKDLFQIQKKVIDISDEIYVLADSSKFEKTGLLKLCDMSSEYTYVTDANIKKEYIEIYKENNIKIYTGKKNGGRENE